MPKDRATFLSANGKRRVLIVDDELVNREILKAILEGEYEVLLAEDGEEAMKRVWEYRDTLSLVLLDLVMPNLPGQEVLKRLKSSPEVQSIPVIVASADLSQEIECLQAGASDFIQKPYPDAGVILARVLRTIELSEDRQIIQSTERDPITGLYNREYFYSYAEQYDQHHKDMPTDAIVIDVDHFALLHERYGRDYANNLLKSLGEIAREVVHDSGGIVCRRRADVFQIYCPHRDDYKALLDKLTAALAETQDATKSIRLLMGVYSNVDKSLDIGRRFDRAVMAAESVRESTTRSIGVYDDTLHKTELYLQKLMDDFPQAIEQRQFVVYYQPKIDILTLEPRLNSAEALVRWEHPELGMVNPGVFIPLFEENGLVQKLDYYVWDEAARQIREWKDALGWHVPISVNASRVDLYDAGIVGTLQDILDRHGLDAEDIRLEVTESAYAEDSKQIIETVQRLRAAGLKIEMDDFGTGYSSLNVLTTLPIDALKLDVSFVKEAFSKEDEVDTHMLEVVIDIAGHLAVPVVAEGIETEEQMRVLKDLGCETVQGYYFSEPVPAGRFEPFLLQGKASQPVAPKVVADDAEGDAEWEDETDTRKRWWQKLPSVPLRRAEILSVVFALVAAVALFVADSMVVQGFLEIEQANDRYVEAQQAATDLEMGSDYLTDNVRSFVVTGEIGYLENYFEELDVTKRRDAAVENLEMLLAPDDRAAYDHLETALSYSNELVYYEYLAMRLVVEAGDYDVSRMPRAIRAVQLTPQQTALSPEEKQAQAEELVFGDLYAQYKDNIKSNTAECTEKIIASSSQARAESAERMNVLLSLEATFTVVFLLVVLAIVLFISGWVRLPLDYMVKRLDQKKTVPPAGAAELRFVAETYNTVFEENRMKVERLNYGSMHDALTGLFNRKAYDIMKRDMDMSGVALLLVDVDKFKTINDTYGHDVGDMVLKRVAEVLGYNFRSSDLVFRLGGDEFVVIMTNTDSSARDTVMAKIDQANSMLQKPVDGLPPTSLSVGAAFADRDNPEGDIFKDADTALYRMKQSGRCGCVIY